MRSMLETLPGVRIVAGTPGVSAAAGEGEIGRYPSSTTDIAKLLRERGLLVDFEHGRDKREYLSLHAADVWIPIIELTLETLLAVGSGLIGDVIGDWLKSGDATSSTLHVTYRVVDSDGVAQEYSAVGAADDVLRAIDRFERKQLGTTEAEV